MDHWRERLALLLVTCHLSLVTASNATCARLMGFFPERISHIAETAKFLGNASVELIDQLAQPVTVADPPFRVVPEFQHLRAS